VDRQALLTFVSAGRRLALPMETVRRVVPVPLLEPPVGAPAFVEGFFDFGGTPVAAVRLDRLLNLGEEPLGIYSPLLILSGEDPPVALHVTSVTSILKLTSLDVQPIGRDETFNACVVGRLSDRGETVYVLSAKDLLLAEERTTIAAHRATHRRRLAAVAEADAEALAHAS
jgi:chemotaxis signal transduction protein